MGEYCTCGALLVPDARFCHKCGRPVREEPEPVSVEPAPQPAPLATTPVHVEVGFHNRTAVRIGLLAALLALLVGSLPLSPWLPLAGMLGAGALAVYLYNRKTGSSLTLRGGVRMGWMTGVFGFVFSMAMTTIALLAMSGRSDALERALREQSGFSPEMVERALEILRSPAQLLVSLLLGFVLFSLTAALGGALGARVFGKH